MTTTDSTSPVLGELCLDQALEPGLATVVADYLSTGDIIWVSADVEVDVLDSALGVPVGRATDGDITWSLAIGHYVDNHGVGASPELVDHICSQVGVDCPDR